MSIQTDYEKRVEAAAKQFEKSDFLYWNTQSIKLSNPTLRPKDNKEYFIAGVAWAEANPSPAVEALKTEVERLSNRYKNIELANKDMTRNDHATFGQLLTENTELRQAASLMKAALEEVGTKITVAPTDDFGRPDFYAISSDRSYKILRANKVLNDLAPQFKKWGIE